MFEKQYVTAVFEWKIDPDILTAYTVPVSLITIFAVLLEPVATPALI